MRLVRLAIRNLAGVPSIVYGLFLPCCALASLGTSLVAAILTLDYFTALMISVSEEVLKTVPTEHREAALALGATLANHSRRRTPQAISGMLTGAILGVSRAVGETAVDFNSGLFS